MGRMGGWADGGNGINERTPRRTDTRERDLVYSELLEGVVEEETAGDRIFQDCNKSRTRQQRQVGWDGDRRM